jgi:DNA-binding CsgD family transcriptional regulator
VAIADRDGRIVHLGVRLFDWMRERRPGWDGRQLPRPLPSDEALHVSEQDGHVWLLLGAGTGSGPRLAPRRLHVARLFAEGQSNKDIARRLGLSPATVRTYLRDTYLELGVRNKIELGEALEDGAATTKRSPFGGS